MNKEVHSRKQVADAAEARDVIRLLAPLADSPAELPSSDAVYWRARARLALKASRQRQQRAARPLQLFHLALGVGAIATAVIGSTLPLYVEAPLSGVGVLVPTLLTAVAALGACFVVESHGRGGAGFESGSHGRAR